MRRNLRPFPKLKSFQHLPPRRSASHTPETDFFFPPLGLKLPRVEEEQCETQSSAPNQMGLLWMIKDGIQGASLGSSSSPNCSLKRRCCRTLLLLRSLKCPPGLFAAVPAAGPSHASTYRPLKTTAFSTASCPTPATSATTSMVPARPIAIAATITLRPELPARESSSRGHSCSVQPIRIVN